MERHTEAYVEELIATQRTVFVEVKRPNRGQWVFDFDPDDDAFFESKLAKATSKLYDGPLEGGFYSQYYKYRNCTAREYSDPW